MIEEGLEVREGGGGGGEVNMVHNLKEGYWESVSSRERERERERERGDRKSMLKKLSLYRRKQSTTSSSTVCKVVFSSVSINHLMLLLVTGSVLINSA